MSSPQVTVIVVPRERYSGILPSIASLYANTEVPFELVVVDGGFPEAVKSAVEAESARRNFRFVHRDYPLTPNEARNIGLAFVQTPYVIFADNDVLYTPNWLPPLIAAAEEFGAWLVGPTILDGEPERGLIHAAGGDSAIEEIDGRRLYHMVPQQMQQQVSDVALQRGPTTMLEFHVLLARRDVFDRLGPLDEGISSFGDHDDLVHGVLQAGGPVIYEPASRVAYHDPGTNNRIVEPADLAMFLLRWSDEWTSSSIDRFSEKWDLDPTDPWKPHALTWVQTRRRRSYRAGGLPGRLVGFVTYKVSRRLGSVLERGFCSWHTRTLRRIRVKGIAEASRA